MKDKAEGVNDKCFCGTEVICRLKPASQSKDGKIYPEKLQWQNIDGSAHYNYDFKTKTTSCNIEGVKKDSPQQNLDNPSTSSLESLNERITGIEGILQSILHIVVDLKTQQNKEEDALP